MNLAISPEAQKSIEDWVRSGRYATAEDVVHAALAALRRQTDEFKPGELDELLAEGEESIARGGTLDGDEAYEARRRRRASRRDAGPAGRAAAGRGLNDGEIPHLPPRRRRLGSHLGLHCRR